MMNCIYIFIGGGLGAICRYGVSNLMDHSFQGNKFPTGILTCNLIGCFLIGLIMANHEEESLAWLHPLIVVGFLGGFTTFSTFGLETLKLLDAGHHTTMVLYIFSTMLGCLAVLFLAVKIIR